MSELTTICPVCGGPRCPRCLGCQNTGCPQVAVNCAPLTDDGGVPVALVAHNGRGMRQVARLQAAAELARTLPPAAPRWLHRLAAWLAS